MMTTASGRWVSEPMPWDRAIGRGKHGEQRGHQDRAQARAGPLHDRVKGLQALVLELVEITHHDNAVQDGLAEERDETNGADTLREFP